MYDEQMTVRELIAMLTLLDQDAPVFRDDDGSICEVTHVTFVNDPDHHDCDRPYVLID